MDKLLDSISRLYNSTLEFFNVKKPEKTQPAQPEKPPVAENVPASSLSNGETISMMAQKLGKAPPNFGMTKEEMVDNWIKLGRNGNRVLTDLKNEKYPEQAVMQFVNQHLDDLVHAEDGSSPDKIRARKEQFKSNIREFINTVSSSEVTVDGKKVKLIDSIRGGLRKDGITFEQLEALGNGDFNAEAYSHMVKNQIPEG